MSFKDTLLRVFTWWHGQTFGTQFFTWRFGEKVGSDEFGNIYYRAIRPEIDPSMGPERRWVVYNGPVEASRVPPEWRAWMQHTVDIPPSEQAYEPRSWEKPHVANLTGTSAAYRPPGSELASGGRRAATGDYVPWTPGG
jgi:NADH:ubiquinone oxidoreductase subunit